VRAVVVRAVVVVRAAVVERPPAVAPVVRPAAARGAARRARVAAAEGLGANLTATMRGAVLPHASLTFASALALAAVTAAGCHSDPMLAASSDADFYSCAEETRAIPYMKGMTLDSSGGTFALAVLDNTFEVDDVPRSQDPAKGLNAWTVQITDVATGLPTDGVIIKVTPRMPDHPNHGTLEVVVNRIGAGTYDVKPLYLYMAGLWNVKFEIQRPDAATGAGGAGVAAPAPETATFPICIPG